jgi:hypothetical protein
MPDEERVRLEADINTFTKDMRAAQLTPVQRAARPLVYVFVLGTLAALITVVAVWVAKLPAVPSSNASPAQIATYRELTGIAGDSAKDLLEEIFTKALLPLLLAFGGVFLGTKLKNND